MESVLNDDAVVLLLVKANEEALQEGGRQMIHTQTPEKLAQRQKLDRELAAVLMAISVTTRSIARNIHLLSMQRQVKGVNPYDKR